MHVLYGKKKGRKFYRLLLYFHCLQADAAVKALQNYEYLNNRVNYESHRCTVHFVKSLQLLTNKC